MALQIHLHSGSVATVTVVETYLQSKLRQASLWLPVSFQNTDDIHSGNSTSVLRFRLFVVVITNMTTIC